MRRGRLAIGIAGILVATAALAPHAGGRSAAGHGVAAPPRRILAYAQPDERGRSWIWSARLDATKATRLTRGVDPAVSPNGQWIAFRRPVKAYDYALGVVRADGSQLRTLVASGVWRIAWLPDSSALAVQGRPGLGIVGLRGERRLLAPHMHTNGAVGDFTVTRDGATTVFAREVDSEEGDDGADLFAVHRSTPAACVSC